MFTWAYFGGINTNIHPCRYAPNHTAYEWMLLNISRVLTAAVQKNTVSVTLCALHFLSPMSRRTPMHSTATSGVFINLKRGTAHGYISGVHFRNCSNFSTIFFTLNISTQIFSHPKGGGRHRAPWTRPWEQLNTGYGSWSPDVSLAQTDNYIKVLYNAPYKSA